MKFLLSGILIFLTGVSCSLYGQQLIVPKDISILADTVAQSQLINALNGLLDQKEKPNRQNTFILPEDLLEMSALLDEFKGMDRNQKTKDDHFYKPYLTNLADIGGNKFLVQICYQGFDGDMPVLRSCFRLLARRTGGRYYFYSPLKENTVSWKVKTLTNVNFHFKDTLNKSEADAFVRTISSYDTRLKVPSTPVEYYFCDNFPEVLQISGVDYEMDYRGIRYNDLTSHENNTSLMVNGGYYGGESFDRHDLWHARLRLAINPDVINRPVDEGCAYLYGGSWGIAWPDILSMLKKYADAHPDADWVKLYINTTHLTNDDRPLIIAYAINALLVQKIEKQSGFAPVMELISCGKRTPGDENYFNALQKAGGVSKANFNSTIWGLLKGM